MKNTIQEEINKLVIIQSTEGTSDSRTEEYLKKKHEKDVFCHVHSMVNGSTIITSKRYYTVLNGFVHEIFNGKIGSKTGDSVFCLTYQCIYIGKYNPKNKYLQKSYSHKYSEFCKNNKIT